METFRQLAAILFSGIAGYTALMHGVIYIFMKEYDRALACIEKAVMDRESVLPLFRL